MKLYLFPIAFFLSTFSISAQNIFTIDGENVSVDDFKTMYEKSQTSSDGNYSKSSVDDYLDLFVNYKLKLKDAEERGFYDDPEVLREIAMYEDQLVRSEFDKKVMNQLMSEVEQRLKEEICIRHILIDIPSRYVGTKDTIFSYNQALKVRDQIIAGGDFEYVAKKNSRDIDTKFSGGDLGCFTTLQLKNYSLENAAYKMQRGQISMPVRTHLGYHIIEVTDRRPSNGLVSASQLFVRSNNTLEREERNLAKSIIDSANILLRQGNDFEDVAVWINNKDGVQTSYDEIPEFMVGSYEKAFENAIFDLNQVGDISSPVETSLGWHIFKLDSRRDLPSFDEMESVLRDKVTEDERYVRARQSFGAELKRKYQFEKDDDVVRSFARQVAPGISIDNWLTPSAFDYSQVFFKIGDRSFTARDFVRFVREKHELEIFKSFQNYYDEYETNNLIEYHKNNLVDTDPEMKALMREFRDGIILFNVMEDESWRKATTDDAAVKQHYQDLKSQFKYPDQIEVTKYTFESKKEAAKLYSGLQEKKSKLSTKRLLKKYGHLATQETLEDNDPQLKGVDLLNVGATQMVANDMGQQVIYITNNVIKGKSAPYEDVSKDVLDDYKKMKESEYIEGLKAKYPVKINTNTLESLYK